MWTLGGEGRVFSVVAVVAEGRGEWEGTLPAERADGGLGKGYAGETLRFELSGAGVLSYSADDVTLIGDGDGSSIVLDEGAC